MDKRIEAAARTLAQHYMDSNLGGIEISWKGFVEDASKALAAADAVARKEAPGVVTDLRDLVAAIDDGWQLESTTETALDAIALIEILVAGAQGWLPIESASKDGTEIWVYDPDREVNGRRYVALWNKLWSEPGWQNCMDNGGGRGNPTLWHLLPVPPSEADDD